MAQDVRFIEIFFQNIESIEIPAQHFNRFRFEDTSLSLYGSGTSRVARNNCAKHVYLTLDPEANQIARTFEGDVHSIKYEGETLFERLQRLDIVSFGLIYADGSKDDISVPWEDEENNEFRNCLQTTEYTDDGSLRIQINAKTK